NQRTGLWAFIEDLGLAFIDAAAAAHRSVPWFVKIHVMPWVPVLQTCNSSAAGRRGATQNVGRRVRMRNLPDQRAQYNPSASAGVAPLHARITSPSCCLD